LPSIDILDVNLHARLTRDLHRELTHQLVMFRGSGWGQGMCSLLLFPDCCGRAGLEAEAVVSGLQDVASMGEAVEKRCGHPGVAEDGGHSLKLRFVVMMTLVRS